MKLTAALVSLLFGAAALASPVAEPEPEPEPALQEKRDISCVMTGSNVKYYKCASKSKCPAVGQTGYNGQKITVSCLTTGEKVNNNDPYWWRLAGSSPYKGNYIPYMYVDCHNVVQTC